MANASYLQASFVGGEWGSYAQGRADLENYRTACNLVYNYVPLEVGAATRRPGTAFCATTRNGLPAILREFHFSQNAPYDMEFTDGHMRLFAGQSLVLEFQNTVATISSANPAVVATVSVHGWSTGDQVEFQVTPIVGASPAGPAPLFNRQFSITVIDTTHFSLQDPVTGANIDGSTINLSGWDAVVARVVDFATSYTSGIWATNRIVQDDEVAFVLNGAVQPYVLTNTAIPTGLGTNDAVFTFGAATFYDGPYLDPPTDSSTLTPDTTSGSVTLTASAITSINGGQGFQATDVGRFVRLFSEPLNWSSGSAYSTGNPVRFETGTGPAYYVALVSNTNIQPDLDNGTNWAISTTVAAWTWGIIDTVTDSTHVVATLQPSAIDIYQQPLAGGSLLYTNPITVWRLGVYSATTGYPTCGCFNGGRFFFAGALGNRFDTTMSNDNFRFSPTLLDGTVADNCGMSETLKGEDINRPLWLLPAAEGVIIGTQGGEWLVQASTLNEPLTPTSIDAKKVTKYGCADIEPRNTGLSYVFVQRYAKQVFEYLADVYSRKFQGTNIARKAKHLTGPGVAEIAYQAESAPVVWARTVQNKLIGCTYKRESPFSTQPASFMGWHQHTLGSGRLVECIRGGPSPDGTLDSIMLVTNDPATNIRYVEILSPFFEETGLITDAWFVDAAVTPTAAQLVGNTVVFYGLQYIAGKTVTAWFGGVDGGDYVVSATGTVTVPIDGTANPLLTAPLLAALTAQGGFGRLGMSILRAGPSGGLTAPNGTTHNFTFTHAANASYANGFVDFDRNICYFDAGAPVSGDPSTNGHTLHAMNLTTQAEEWTVGPGEFAFAASAGTALGADGNLYFATIDASHIFGRFNTTTRAVDRNVVDNSILSPGYLVTIELGDDTFLLSTGLGAGALSAQWVLVNMTIEQGGPATMTSGFFDENIGSIGPGNAFPTRGPPGSAYVFVQNEDNTVVGVYRAAVNSLTSGGMAKLGTITPTQVHSGLTSLQTGPTKIIYDETDGNLIAVFTGSDSNLYLVKVRTSDAAVLWSTAVSGASDLWRSRVRFGVLTFFGSTSGGHYNMLQVNTITGAIVTTVLTPGSFTSGWTMADDKTGYLVFQIGSNGAQQWATFGPSAQTPAPTPTSYYSAPAVFGFNYSSKLQILRPIAGQELQTPTGPAQGKTRRSHMHATLLANSQGAYFGTDFTKMHIGKLLSPGRTVSLANNILFTGTIQDTLADDYSYDSMWATMTLRPYPTNIVSVEAFVRTQER